MDGRWRAPSAFRADPYSPAAARPSRRQATALLAALVLVCGVVAVLSYVVRPDRARAFDLFHGSVFLSDQLGPVAADLASGMATLRLVNANDQVGITGSEVLDAIPLTDHTLLLNPASGEFNMVDNNGFIVKHDGSGVPLAARPAPTTAAGVDAGAGLAYIVRTGPRGGTDVYLVSQPTVEAAVNATNGVSPRASGSMPEQGSTAPGGAASANGDLWLLVGRTGSTGLRTIRQLQVPVGSSAGSTLVASDHGRVNGPAAIGTAATGAATGVVAVASVSRIDIFGSGTDERTATYAAPDGVDAILPATNTQGRVAFLMHGSAGWYVLSVGADGTDLRIPALLDGVPPNAALAAPAASNGRLYTVDRSSGKLYEIDPDASAAPLPDGLTYPVVAKVEEADYRDAYVWARGPRVVVNSPTHTNALMLFTDGSSAPRVIAKTNAVRVDAAGGAEALTRSNLPAGTPKPPEPGTPKPRPVDVQPVNPRLNCHSTAVKPHIPVITSAVPGSRTVGLSWRYPVITPQDCIPSTYLVSVTLVGNDAPQPPGSVRVQAQTGATLSGLFPSTGYQVTVTALINGQGTSSPAAFFTTGVEGPQAPTDLSVAADSSGSWTLDWDSCGTVEQGCVATQSWTITPSFCDRRSVASPPAPITVTADPSARRQPAATYSGGDDLLGRGLRFQVQGTGTEGQAGTPSAPSPCVFSWATPVGADLQLRASTPPQTAGGDDTTTTTARVTFAGGRVHDLGGVGGTLTYQLLSAASVVDTVGPTTAGNVTLHGIRAGARYQVRVFVSPPRHPEVTVPIGPVDVVPAVAEWPALLVDQPTFDAPPGLAGTLHVRFTFPAGAGARGETFDLVNSQLTCGGGNVAMNLTAADVAPGEDMAFPVDRTTYRGPCTVTLQLAQDPVSVTDPPLYGAGTSPARTSPSVILDPPSITATADDFSAQWAGNQGHPTVIVSFHGADELSGARDWQLTLTRGVDTCGSAAGDPLPVAIEVDKQCVSHGSGEFSVRVEYTYFGIAHAAYDVPVSGDAPEPVDPTKLSFTAQWNSNPLAPQIVLDYTGSEPAGVLAPLDWTEVVTSSALPGVVCASASDDPAAGTVRIPDVLVSCPATLGLDGQLPIYSVEISFTDPNYDQTGDYPTPVTGVPPQ
ncbi:MAG: hypothetical protein QOJ34_2912 [Pseudonocardiales bacterium]|nr:hypothetical protein [Pseudonocardiales bacterium]